MRGGEKKCALRELFPRRSVYTDRETKHNTAHTRENEKKEMYGRNKKLLTLALSGALLCSMGAPSLAAGNIPSPKAEGPGAGDVQPLPDSQLYFGEV